MCRLTVRVQRTKALLTGAQMEALSDSADAVPVGGSFTATSSPLDEQLEVVVAGTWAAAEPAWAAHSFRPRSHSLAGSETSVTSAELRFDDWSGGTQPDEFHSLDWRSASPGRAQREEHERRGAAVELEGAQAPELERAAGGGVVAAWAAPVDLGAWDVDEVAGWLRGLAIVEADEQALEGEGVDGRALEGINDTMLRMAGVSEHGAAKILWERQLLRERLKPRPGQLRDAVSAGSFAMVQDLLSRGADPNGEAERVEEGRSPLHKAAGQQHLLCCQLLLAAGADPDCRSNLGGITPLMTAAAAGHECVVALLLEAGADPTLKRKFGETARRIAEVYDRQAIILIIDEHIRLRREAKAIEK